MKNILLFSSGIDSFIGYFMLRESLCDTIDLVYFYNEIIPYAPVEMKYVIKFRDELMVKDDRMYILTYPRCANLQFTDSFIPARNLVFALATCFRTSVDKTLCSDTDINIYLGGLRDDRVGDNSPEFCEYASKVLSLSFNKNITIKSVFDYKFSKYEIVRWFLDTYPNKSDLLESHTFSCYSPVNNEHCYSCRACFRRNVALQDLIILPFNDKKKLKQWTKEITRNKDQYDPIRYEKTLSYISILEKASKALKRRI